MRENKFWNYSITIGNMIVTLAFGLGVGLVVLLFTLIVRSILSKKCQHKVRTELVFVPELSCGEICGSFFFLRKDAKNSPCFMEVRGLYRKEKLL